jgi:hypothetical protein
MPQYRLSPSVGISGPPPSIHTDGVMTSGPIPPISESRTVRELPGCVLGREQAHAQALGHQIAPAVIPLRAVEKDGEAGNAVAIQTPDGQTA